MSSTIHSFRLVLALFAACGLGSLSRAAATASAPAGDPAPGLVANINAVVDLALA